jgi:hypothetical protein
VFVRSDWIDQSQKQARHGRLRTSSPIGGRARAGHRHRRRYVDVALHAFSRFTMRAGGGMRIDGLSLLRAGQRPEAQGQVRLVAGRSLRRRRSRSRPRCSRRHRRPWPATARAFRSPQARSLAEGQTTPFTRVRSFEGRCALP